MPFGIGGHDSNYLTDVFEHWFRLEKHYNSDLYWACLSYERYLANQRRRTLIEREILQNRINERKNTRNKLISYGYSSDDFSHDPYVELEYDMLEFFLNCYQNDTFMEGLGKDCSIMNELEFFNCQFIQRPDESDEEFNQRKHDKYYYHWYQKHMILDWMKDVYVEYLGYHYVARTPRTIYTSNFNIYETFYNYLLNDFTIYRLPKMIYNPQLKRYEENIQNEFYIPDSELRLKDEIHSIKRLVSQDERYKYYR